jgi:hypothetical protein
MLVSLSCSGTDAGNARKGTKAEANTSSGIQIDQLNTVISEYSGKSGFEVIKVGKLGTSAIKALVKFGIMSEGDGDDAREIIKMVSGIKKLAVVDYEECESADKSEFSRKIEGILRDDFLLMEAKDGSDAMKLYGVMDKKNDKIGNFILYTPSECALICLFGTIDMSAITAFMAQ